ncbi:hypothetical protein HBA54_21070 [Pelagibius litoralis]|uniref:Uncharacterized protein n=1 Tax=Pelagibius litoralis TaxID=374515 RepID=A0A967F115_9PROT|nr:hypothetical protein [Pelagibius litoralis]NIA71094.1 hypothetical protein [Pelagibius litoralis]
MFKHLFKIAFSVVLASSVLMTASGGALAQSNKTFSTNKNSIPVVIQTDEGREVVRYSQLNPTQKRQLDRVLLSLKNAGPDLPPLNQSKIRLKAIDRNPEAAGCGFNSTGSEPFQFGCWIGGKVCYVSAGPGGVDGGCHQCNGTNCPKD